MKRKYVRIYFLFDKKSIYETQLRQSDQLKQWLLLVGKMPLLLTQLW